ASVAPDSQLLRIYEQITQQTYRQMGIILRSGDFEAAQNLAMAFFQRPQPQNYPLGYFYAGMQSRYALSVLLSGDAQMAKQLYHAFKLENYTDEQSIAQAIADIQALEAIGLSHKKTQKILRLLRK
ncbi:MAG: hypothetical protein AAFR59_19160, partial [Bacteroidota bacterium]